MKYKINYGKLDNSLIGGSDQKEIFDSYINEDDMPNISNKQSLEDIMKYLKDNDGIKLMSEDLDKSFKKILEKIKGLDYKTNLINKLKLDKFRNFLKKINKIESSDVPKIKDDLFKINNEALEKMSLLKRNENKIGYLNDYIKKVNQIESSDIPKIKDDLYKVNNETLKKISLLKRNNKDIDNLNDFVKKINELESTDIPKIKDDLNKINSQILKKISLLKSNKDIDNINVEILSNYIKKVNKFINILKEATDFQKEKDIRDSLNAINAKINKKLVNIVGNLKLKINEKSTELKSFKCKIKDILELFKKISKELNNQEYTNLRSILDEINKITVKKLNEIKKQSESNIKLIKSYKEIFYKQTIKYIKIIRVLYRLKNIYVNKQRKFNNYIIIIENIQNGNKYDYIPKKSDEFFDNPYIEL